MLYIFMSALIKPIRDNNRKLLACQVNTVFHQNELYFGAKNG